MTTERDRLGNLVSQMESAVSQDQANKALVADLKSEIEKHKGIRDFLFNYPDMLEQKSNEMLGNMFPILPCSGQNL